MSGAQFATDPRFIAEGFNRIVGGIDFPLGVAARIAKAFEQAHRNGDPRMELHAFQLELEGREWVWPWFDLWRDRFAGLGRWQVMWGQYAKALNIASAAPQSTREACSLFTVAEMRTMLAKLGPAIKPKGKSRVECELVFSTEVRWADIAAEVAKRHQENVEDAKQAMEQQCLELLAHSVSMAVYAARDAARELPRHWNRTVRIDDDDAHLPWLKERTARVEAGDLTELPPYFPGDRSYVTTERVASP